MLKEGKWNTGLLVKSLLTRKTIIEYFLLIINPDKDGIFDIPLFHHSMCEAEDQTSKNSFVLNKLYNLRDVIRLERR